MIVLDTTVLIYAVGTEHPLRDPCRRIIEAVGAGSYVDLLAPLARPDAEDLRKGLALFAGSDRLRASMQSWPPQCSVPIT